MYIYIYIYIYIHAISNNLNISFKSYIILYSGRSPWAAPLSSGAAPGGQGDQGAAPGGRETREQPPLVIRGSP